MEAQIIPSTIWLLKCAIGLLIQNNDGTTVSIKNTQIYNSNYGILAQTAKINGENVVINTAGLAV
jgi:hypothetical protein